jgi:uncharacterized protein
MEKAYICNMLERKKTETLIEILEHFPVLGIVGPRQVGKTTLAKFISAKINKNSIYLDLENPKDIVKLTDPILFFEGNQDKCIILDEIQRMPELFPILRSMIDNNRVPGRFLILGSASPDLIRDASESLAGRIAYEELTPFNILEMGNLISLHVHWMNGGFPDSVLSRTERIRDLWLKNFIQTYVERDLPMLGLDINRSIIQKLWTMVAHIHGNTLNMNNLAKSLELTSTTIKKYLAFLEEAFLIRQLQSYSQNIKKRLVKSPKIYIRDSGILHYLLGIDNMDSLQGNPIIGNSWEGYAIEQICQLLPERIQPYYYRTHQGAECDLVLVKSGKPIKGIEIKYTSSPKLSKGNLQSFEDLGTTDNYIITPNSDNYLISKNVRVCNLKDFLELYLRL